MNNKKGRVTLIGAGPGDKGLITVKGLEYLKQADVVVYDRLVSHDVLSLSPETAELINVGKVMNHHNIPQPEINKILLNKAMEGKNVVRLKGGDPFVFGRGGEELELLTENNIEFEIIPGITSAISALAYSGIPVTHRDFASSIHFVTGHAKDGLVENIDFNHSELNINFKSSAYTRHVKIVLAVPLKYIKIMVFNIQIMINDIISLNVLLIFPWLSIITPKA